MTGSPTLVPMSTHPADHGHSHANDPVPAKPIVPIAYAENVSGVPTDCTGNFTYAPIDGVSLTIPAQATPFTVQWEASLKATTPGAGAAYVALMEGGQLVQSASLAATAANSGTYSTLLGNVTGRRHFGPTQTTRVFTLALVNLLDGGSALTTQAANTDTNPTWMGATTA